MPTDALAESTKATIFEKLEGEYNCLTVDVSDSDFDGHYTHFCKTILWPMFIYQIPDNRRARRMRTIRGFTILSSTRSLRSGLLEAGGEAIPYGSKTYHFLLVPAMLRELLPDAQIEFS
jgi:trehalose 6-phosphate synthase/phosphatase